MRHVEPQHKVTTSDPVIAFRENNRIMRFINSSRKPYIKVHIDGCAVTQGLRCDFLMTSDDEREEHFIELKGTDVKHAIEQLKASISNIGEYSDNRHAYIVSTNQAPALRTSVQRAKLEFRNKFKSTLDVKERHIEVRLS